MSAIPKEELERLEKQHGLSEDGLSYQLRCSRITAYQKGEGEQWTPPEKTKKQTKKPTKELFGTQHPLYGKRILITPMMRPDAKRAIYYEEVLGPYMEVDEVNAGEAIYGAGEDVDRMVGDYKIKMRDPSRRVIAKTNLPKIGTEISWLIGKELVPVVRGNSGARGYIWSIPTQVIQVEDTLIQIYGLKTLIENVWPELLPKFSGKPMMEYIDGVTLAASIPQTHALLKEHRRKELVDRNAGIYQTRRSP